MDDPKQKELPLGGALVATDPPPSGPAKEGALADFQTAMMTIPADRMGDALAEYESRRRTFREWLLGQLVEGVHFGFPPGTEPKYNAQGQRLMYTKKGMVPADDRQWQPVKSLYQAGADFICDLMGVAHEFSPDMESWTQGGEVKGHFFSICRLRSRQTNEIIGEGRGAHKIGSRKDENTALKMAQKSAKVAAVLNSYGLSDLFTQDLEDGAGQIPAHENPVADPDAATAQPRGNRVSSDELKTLVSAFNKEFPENAKLPTPEERKASFAGWIECNALDGAPMEWNPLIAVEWPREVFTKCMDKLKGIQ